MHLSLISFFCFLLCVEIVYNSSASQCQKTGHKSCLGIDGSCVSIQSHCSTVCLNTNDCPQSSTLCCLQGYCQMKENCYSSISNSRPGPSMVVIILPIFDGVCVLLFIICVIIHVIRRRRRMSGQQQLKVEPLGQQQIPTHQFDANNAMTKVNHLNMYSANVQQEKLLKENVIIPQIVLPPSYVSQNYYGQPQNLAEQQVQFMNGTPFILKTTPQKIMINYQSNTAGNSSDLKALYL